MTNATTNSRRDFLLHYQRDAQRRWSAADRRAQQEFVNQWIAGKRWLDWSNESATLELLQANFSSTGSTVVNQCEALVLAGPIVELLPPTELFQSALTVLEEGGCLVGLYPCLRDNSPESQLFAELAAATLWPYYTAEELSEVLAETSGQPNFLANQFVPISRFNDTVLKDELAFTGFRQIFTQLEAQGYDPSEVGWGEWRFAAQVEDE